MGLCHAQFLSELIVCRVKANLNEHQLLQNHKKKQIYIFYKNGFTRSVPTVVQGDSNLLLQVEAVTYRYWHPWELKFQSHEQTNTKFVDTKWRKVKRKPKWEKRKNRRHQQPDQKKREFYLPSIQSQVELD